MERLAILLVALGAALRLVKYLQRPGLWTDEAFVALNIGRRSYAELTAQLDYTQLAPIPWLWLEKLVVDIAGMNELALRFPALIAGILLPWLVWKAGLQLVGRWGAVIATALTTMSATLLYFATEAKPYGSDAAIAALLLWLGGRCLMQPIGDRSLHVLGAVGAVAVSFSFPSVFVLGGIGIALLVRACLAHQRVAIGSVVAWGVVWVLIFALPQLLLYRDMAAGAEMQEFWRPVMAQLGEPGFMGRTSAAVNALLTTLIGRPMWPGSELYLLVLGFGAWTIARKRGLITMLLVTVPFLLLGVAWLAGQIPAMDRLLLFASPLLALLFGAAVAQLIHYVPYRTRPVGVTVVAVPLTVLMLAEVYEGFSRIKPTEGRALVALITESPAVPVWLTKWSTPIWVYYTTDWAAPDTTRLDWYATQADDAVQPVASPSAEQDAERVSSRRGWTERLAWPSGVKPEAGGVRDDGLVEEWAVNEVRQMATVISSRPWMLMLHEKPAERAALSRAADQLGLDLTIVGTQKRSTLFRLARPRDQPSSAVSNSDTVSQR